MSDLSKVSRRVVVGGLVATTAGALVRLAPASPFRKEKKSQVLPTAAGQSSPDGSFAIPRLDQAVAPLGDGRILVTGGYTFASRIGASGVATPTAGVQIYNPFDDSWTTVAPMRSARAKHAAVSLGQGLVAVLGGASSVPLSSVEVYDARLNIWEHVGNLPMPMDNVVATLVDSSIIVFGLTEQAPVRMNLSLPALAGQLP